MRTVIERRIDKIIKQATFDPLALAEAAYTFFEENPPALGALLGAGAGGAGGAGLSYLLGKSPLMGAVMGVPVGGGLGAAAGEWLRASRQAKALRQTQIEREQKRLNHQRESQGRARAVAVQEAEEAIRRAGREKEKARIRRDLLRDVRENLGSNFRYQIAYGRLVERPTWEREWKAISRLSDEELRSALVAAEEKVPLTESWEERKTFTERRSKALHSRLLLRARLRGYLSSFE